MTIEITQEKHEKLTNELPAYMDIIKEIREKDPYIEIGAETVCFFCGELENMPHDNSCVWKNCQAHSIQNMLMNMKPSEWPKSLRDYVTTKSASASGGVIADLIEMWITE